MNEMKFETNNYYYYYCWCYSFRSTLFVPAFEASLASCLPFLSYVYQYYLYRMKKNCFHKYSAFYLPPGFVLSLFLFLAKYQQKALLQIQYALVVCMFSPNRKQTEKTPKFPRFQNFSDIERMIGNN